MPNPYQYTVDQEIQFFKELQNINLRNERFRQLVTPELAQNVSRLAYNAPYAPKDVLMTAGRALTDNLISPQQADDIVVGTEKKVLTSPLTYTFDSKSSPGQIWDQMFEGIKSGAKWGLAGIQLFADPFKIAAGAAVSGGIQTYQAVRNAPAQITQNIMQTGTVAPSLSSIAGPQGSPEFAEYIGTPTLPQSTLIRGAEFVPGTLDADIGTIWRSTELGALFSGADSGNGWFIGGEAKRIQMQNQAKLLGTLNGEPIMPGTIALSATRPGTKPYAILSSLINLGVDVVAPAPPIGSAIRRATRLGSNVDIAPALRLVGAAEPGEVTPLIRSLQGLTNFSAPNIVRSKVSEFLDSTVGQYVMQRLAKTTNYDDVAKLFPKTDVTFRQAIVDATESNIRSVLEENLGLSRGLGNVQDVNIGRLADVKRAMLNNGLSRWTGIERLADKRPGREIAIVTDDPMIATRSIENLSNYLVALRVPPARRNELINQLASSLTKVDANPKAVIADIRNEVIEQLAKQGNLPKPMLEKMFNVLGETTDQYWSFGQATVDARPMMFGLGDTRKAGMLGKNASGQKGIFLIPDGTAGTMAEMRRASLFLPDVDRVYRTTSKLSWLFETLSRNPEKFGNPNSLILLIHGINKIWRKAVTMTGAYAQRNLLESSVRASLAPGVSAGPLNPIDWIRTIVHAEGFGKYLGDVEGIPFDQYAEVLTKAEYKDFGDAVTSVIRENIDSARIERWASETGVWQYANKTSMPALYPQMLMDNIQMVADDEIFRMVARRMTTDDIIDAIKSGDQEAILAVKAMQRRYSNITLYNVGTGQYEKGFIDYIDEMGNINEKNLRRFIDLYARPRVAYNTGGTRRPDGTWLLDGDERLLDIIANGGTRGQFMHNGRIVDAFKKSELGPAGELVSLDYTDEFRDAINEIINDPVMGARMPQEGKARVFVNPLDDRVKFAELSDRFENFGNIFFAQLFGKPDAYLHRSPVWRQFHYQKINDLLDELAPGEAKIIRDRILRAKSYNAKEDIRKLTGVKPQSPLNELLNARQIKGGRFVYGGKTYGLNKYLDDVRTKLIEMGFSPSEADARVNTLKTASTTHRSTKKNVVRQLLNETSLYKYGDKTLTQDEYFEMLRTRLIDLGFDEPTATLRIDDLRDVIARRPGDLPATRGALLTEVSNIVLGNQAFGARWVGSKKLWKRITAMADGTVPSTGTLSAEQISQAARLHAAEETKKTFFDASSKSNFTEVIRAVSPFHGAWGEQMKYFSRLLTQSDKGTKNAAVLIDNMRSFFYNDPVTGEPYFNYGPTDIALPIIFAILGGGVGGVAAGALGLGAAGTAAAVGATAVAGAAGGMAVSGQVEDVAPQLRGPARSLSMAFNVVPGVGPMVQIPANQILNRTFAETQWLDGVREFLMPFGPPTEGILGALTVSWAKKLQQAFSQNPETDTIWAQFKMDSFVALMASGKYDRFDPEDQSRAWQKADTIATYLTIAQSVGQLVGPARPGIAMKIPTEFEGVLDIGDVHEIIKDGNVTNITLARVFRILQEEDFDSAPQKFLEMFGENAIYFMAGRTTTELSGLQANEEFADWELKNSEFAETHRDVFGWFAPLGTTFDKQAYQNQLARGLRERRTDPYKLIDDVEYIAGSAMYRLYQKDLSADGELTSSDKEMLKDWRTTLEDYFPGYKYRSQDISKIDTRIAQAFEAANDSRIAGNVTAEAVKSYEEHRQWAIDSAQARRQIAGRSPATKNILSGQANADLRRYLRDIGESIVQETPEFARIYDAVFFYEIDEVGE